MIRVGKMKGAPCLAWILVHHQNTREVLRFVKHLHKQSVPASWRLQILIVDNSSDFSYAEELEAQIIRPGRNLGYLNGGAYGVEVFREQKGHWPAWTVISNADLVLERGFVETFLTREIPDTVGIVAPDVRTSKGAKHNPFMRRRPSSARMHMRKGVFTRSSWTTLYRCLSAMKNRVAPYFSIPNDSTHPERIPIYAPHGSIFVVRDAFMKQGGSLPYDAFLFGEEVHLAEQARIAEVDVVWMPDLRARHKQKSTVDRVNVERRRKWHLESAEFLCKTYFQQSESEEQAESDSPRAAR
jgi:GT2 family glycosyltransferase